MHKLKFDIKQSYTNAQIFLKPKLILELKNAYIDLKISQHTKHWMQNLNWETRIFLKIAQNTLNLSLDLNFVYICPKLCKHYKHWMHNWNKNTNFFNTTTHKTCK
jgi:hypothetical protein